MKKASLTEVSKSFFLDWFLPTAGRAYAVYAITELVLKALGTSPGKDAFLDAARTLFSPERALWIAGGLIAVGAVFVCAQIVTLQSKSQAPSRWSFRFSRYADWYSKGCLFITGTLVLPLTVIGVVVTDAAPGGFLSEPAFLAAAGSAVAVTAAGFILHWQSDLAKNDARSAAVWVIAGARGADPRAAGTALSKHFEKVGWFEAVELIGTSEDGQAVLQMPVCLPLKSWPEEAKRTFVTLYEGRGGLLTNVGFSITGVSLSPDLATLVEGVRAQMSRQNRKVANVRGDARSQHGGNKKSRTDALA